MAASKEERFGFPTGPVKLETISSFLPDVVDISSSSEKSSTGQAEEAGEETTSSVKGSAFNEQSIESLHKKPRLQTSSEDLHRRVQGEFGDGLPVESEQFEATAHNLTARISDDGESEGRNLNDDSVVDDGDGDLPDDFLEPLDSPIARSPPHGMLTAPVHGHHISKDMLGHMFKQFWKAGDYDSLQSVHDYDFSGGMEHVRVHPKFLHSNATSHKWALGAIAELLDNVLDEAVNGATLANVDMCQNPRDGRPMLMIEDDGGGMDPERMRQCMSLGYSVKSKIANTIGQYGNGFKTSTMRLGADVVVFSRHRGKNSSLPTQSIGLLSYTFLTGTGQEDIIVPMVDYEVQPFGLRKLVRGTLDDWNRNLETILQWCPFDTEQGLFKQIQQIKGQGTIVIVYNLWEDDQGDLELDFDADPYDIQLRGTNRDEKNILMASRYPNCKHYFTYKYSLRSYASILYLRLPKKFRIVLRGKQVVHHKLVNDLMLTQQVTYRPQKIPEFAQKDAVAVVTLGFVKDAEEHIDVQGFNVYHKNRLIKPFWRVWNYPGIQGRGIIGVLEANFVEPAHDKQGFERTTIFARLEARLIEIQKSYWSKNCEEIGYVSNTSRKKVTSKAEGMRDNPVAERSSHPVTKTQTPFLSPVVTKALSSPSTAGQKDLHAGSINLDEIRMKAVPTAPAPLIPSVCTEAFPSQNTLQARRVQGVSHAPSSSQNTGEASLTHLRAESSRKGDARITTGSNISGLSVPLPGKKAPASYDAADAHPSARTSLQPEVTREVQKLPTVPAVSKSRPQSTDEGRIPAVPNTATPIQNTAQALSAAASTGNRTDLEVEAAPFSTQRLEPAQNCTSNLLADAGVNTHQSAELACAAPEPDPKSLLPITLIPADKDPLVSSNVLRASECDVPNQPGCNQTALLSMAGQQTLSMRDQNASQPSHHVSLGSESLQDSSEAVISPPSQCEAPESSQCANAHALNLSPTSTQTQQRRPRMQTRSMLQLRQSHAKAALLTNGNAQQSGSNVQQQVTNGASDLNSLARTTPDEGDASVSTLVIPDAEHPISLESINMLEGKLDAMRQRVQSLQKDLDEVFNERDFLKGELEEERRRQFLVEEELKDKLQAMLSRARELEAANKLMQISQQ